MKKTNVHQDQSIDQFVNFKKVKFFQMEFLFCFLKN